MANENETVDELVNATEAMVDEILGEFRAYATLGDWRAGCSKMRSLRGKIDELITDLEALSSETA